MNRSLVVICGPTASGKSGLALELAEIFSVDIISADSRQIYREFDIGTAKPTLLEMTKVNHHLVNICAPTETLTLAQYQQYANHIIDNSAHFPLLLTGGTGLYIKSIIKGLKIPRVSPQIDLRKQLQALGQTQAYAILEQIDSVSTKKIHANDHLRTLRALEVYYVTGMEISKQQGELVPDYPILQIGLEFNTEELIKRIKHRTHQMISLGLIEEVQQLIKKYGFHLPLLDTLGYAEIKKYLARKITLESAMEEIILHTTQFAKRQRTWFKSDKNIKWFLGTDPNLKEKLLEEIEIFTEQSSKNPRANL
jgi:tRNA dimethylallyltransferase